MDYFLTNIVISLVVLLTLKLLRHAPAKLHLLLLLVALANWFIPWQHIDFVSTQASSLLPSLQQFTFPTQAENAVSHSASSAVSPGSMVIEAEYFKKASDFFSQLLNSFPFSTLFICLSAVGLALFGIDLWRYQQYIRHLSERSEKARTLSPDALGSRQTSFGRRVDIHVTDAPQPGMATGVFKPAIWLNQQFS